MKWRLIRPFAEFEEALERAADAPDVARDRGLVEQLPALVLARGVADLGRAATDQSDRAVARALQPAQQHDADEVADVQAVGGAVEPDVRDDAIARCEAVQPLQVRDLVHEAALDHGAGEFGAMPGHGDTALAGAGDCRSWPRQRGSIEVAVDRRDQLVEVAAEEVIGFV